jgi:hypothetical protein
LQFSFNILYKNYKWYKIKNSSNYLTEFLAEFHEHQHFCLETLASEQVPSPRLEDYEFQVKDFTNNDQHGRVALKQVSTQSLQNGVGVIFYSPNDTEGKQRYEGQIKETLPGNISFKTTERQKDRKTERQKDRKTERQKDRKTE